MSHGPGLAGCFPRVAAFPCYLSIPRYRLRDLILGGLRRVGATATMGGTADDTKKMVVSRRNVLREVGDQGKGTEPAGEMASPYPQIGPQAMIWVHFGAPTYCLQSLHL